MKLRTFFALIPSVIFCFWYLPFKQAIKIPIIVYCPRIFKFGGRVIIDSDKIYFGMIRLGLFITNQYPNAGIRWYNKGTIVFKGRLQSCVHRVILNSGRILEMLRLFELIVIIELFLERMYVWDGMYLLQTVLCIGQRI